jgi:hypothetical protein
VPEPMKVLGSGHVPELKRVFWACLWGCFGSILFGSISSPPSLCSINLQILVKMPGYNHNFVKFSSYKKKG